MPVFSASPALAATVSRSSDVAGGVLTMSLLYHKTTASTRNCRRMSRALAPTAMRNPLFGKEEKLVITSGDRSDMVLAALEPGTIGVLLTNNILPPSNIIAKASEMNVPVLLVPSDTYQVARQIDLMEPLLTRDNAENVGLLVELVKKGVKINEIL